MNYDDDIGGSDQPNWVLCERCDELVDRDELVLSQIGTEVCDNCACEIADANAEPEYDPDFDEDDEVYEIVPEAGLSEFPPPPAP